MKQPSEWVRSTWAVLAGFFTTFVLSIGADQVMHATGVFPPLGQPMFDVGLNALALGYRSAFTIVGGFVTARLAPRAPIKHALALGILGTLAGAASAIATADLKLVLPWMPIAIAVTSLPCTWLGGHIWSSRARNQSRTM